ncbi:hypothetical protein, partial [Xylophilus sp. ASV27]|uniref:hypothetical protein n=1 Tax=Xylophilus sp. ASV27 TaxID=2795129 RepID=UPI001E2A3EA0
DPASIAAGMDQIAALAPDAVIVTAFDPASTWKTQALKLKARNLSLIHISEPTRPYRKSRMPSCA